MLSPRLAVLSAVVAALCLVSVAPNARAFCGFYVSGADAKLFNDATVVVMMREGQRTVLSMQNSYKGPPSDFAMVVPVPVVLKKTNVKILEDAVFDKIDRLAAPRLVEYWEQDPCKETAWDRKMVAVARSAKPSKRNGDPKSSGVKIEAQFKVGEYDIVILSASDSGGLERWLRDKKYNIPKGAEAVLRPYVQAGTKFFVAKVDAKKVKFGKDGRAKLSPLRFHYDTKTFTLPIRLGMLNANGPQDLIVHILAKNKRYEVANYKNVTIPTNLAVTNDVRNRFGEFYAALLDRTLEANKGAVVTEYAWDAATCDPCPGPTLGPADLVAMGADVVPSKSKWGYVLTRLHARYTKATLGEDLVFKEAGAIVGGREIRRNGDLESRSSPGGRNNFQGRYIIRHKWAKPVTCNKPRYGRWGGPPGSGSKKPSTSPALDTARAPRGKVQLASLVAVDIPEIGVKASQVMTLGGRAVKKGPATAGSTPTTPTPGTKTPPPTTTTATTKAAPAPATAPKAGTKPAAPAKKVSDKKGCSGSGSGPVSGLFWLALVGGLGLLLVRRRRLLGVRCWRWRCN